MRAIYSNYATTLTALLLAAMTSLLVSCGTGPSTTTTDSSAAIIQLSPSSLQMPSSGANPVTITATVTTSTGQAVVGQAISFSTGGDPTATISGSSGATDSNGITTATLNLGSNKSNRVIAISATAGAAVGANSVTVTGTTIAISGNSSLVVGGTTALTFSVKDSAGNAVSGMPISVTSSAGNLITPPSGTTISGSFPATVTATTLATTDVITASSAGAVQTLNLSINSSLFYFTAPTSGALIPINIATPISLSWSMASAPVVASSVTFSSSRGTIATPAVTTNAAGVAATTITSNSTGSTIISAAGPNGTPAASINVTFYTNTASSIAVQANPSTVSITNGSVGQTSNISVISVIVRDATNNLVQNAQVSFSDTTDVTGGYLSSATATTDASGAASVNYIAGGVSSPQNGVIITATVISINGVPIPAVTSTVSLTVSGQSLLISLGTDNLLTSNPPQNTKKFLATVTDAGLNPAVGAAVAFKLRPNMGTLYAYYKGHYIWDAANTRWVQVVTATCVNEDDGLGMVPADAYAFNGIVDGSEDRNGDHKLQPGNGTATVTTTGLTDITGNAAAYITFTKDHATWATFVLEARSVLYSNDPPATYTFTLPGLSSDYTDKNVAPPGAVSPYGNSASCADTL